MKIITSEAVFRGHPDKICDQISDAILDACLKQDENSRVAIECLIKDDLVILAGEITTKAKVNYSDVAKKVLKDIGYDECFCILEKISEQSEDIAFGVDEGGAGDQGIMYGYASNETEELMPLSIVLARKIAMKMDELSSEKYNHIFGKDGKCQVSIIYENDTPTLISNIIVSAQTKQRISRKVYEDIILNECIYEVIPNNLTNELTNILINPTGEFVIGGSFADSGLTGRKIICDTYGGVGRHGGGAFSGKDASKVDRSGAYYARYVAKTVVSSKIATHCEVSVAYAIGIDTPVAINVDTFGTSCFNDDLIKKAIERAFNFTPKNIKEELMLNKVNFEELAKYGHVGRTDLRLVWEEINYDKCDQLIEILMEITDCE